MALVCFKMEVINAATQLSIAAGGFSAQASVGTAATPAMRMRVMMNGLCIVSAPIRVEGTRCGNRSDALGRRQTINSRARPNSAHAWPQQCLLPATTFEHFSYQTRSRKPSRSGPLPVQLIKSPLELRIRSPHLVNHLLRPVKVLPLPLDGPVLGR